jgi:hypothetical protein
VNRRLEELAQQRACISAEIAQERAALAGVAHDLQRPLQRIQRVRNDVQFFRERYVYLLLPVALLAVLNPGRTLRVALTAWSAWSAFSRARGNREERLTQALGTLAARRY